MFKKSDHDFLESIYNPIRRRAKIATLERSRGLMLVAFLGLCGSSIVIYSSAHTKEFSLNLFVTSVQLIALLDIDWRLKFLKSKEADEGNK